MKAGKCVYVEVPGSEKGGCGGWWGWGCGGYGGGHIHYNERLILLTFIWDDALWKKASSITSSPDAVLCASYLFFKGLCKGCKDGGLFFFLLSFAVKKCTRFCGVCGSIALLHWWVLWYGWHSFAVIWNWIRGAGEGGRDDEEYQSFCLSCEVICGSTESGNNESSLVHHWGLCTEGEFTFPATPDLEQREPSLRRGSGVNTMWVTLYKALSPTTCVMTRAISGGASDCCVRSLLLSLY